MARLEASPVVDVDVTRSWTQTSSAEAALFDPDHHLATFMSTTA
jgi:hypothetical protein